MSSSFQLFALPLQSSAATAAASVKTTTTSYTLPTIIAATRCLGYHRSEYGFSYAHGTAIAIIAYVI